MARLPFSRPLSIASPSSTNHACCRLQHFAASSFASRPRPRLLGTPLAQNGSIAGAVSSYASVTERSVTFAGKRLTSIGPSSPSIVFLMRRTREPQRVALEPFTSCAGRLTRLRKPENGDESCTQKKKYPLEPFTSCAGRLTRLAKAINTPKKRRSKSTPVCHLRHLGRLCGLGGVGPAVAGQHERPGASAVTTSPFPFPEVVTADACGAIAAVAASFSR